MSSGSTTHVPTASSSSSSANTNTNSSLHDSRLTVVAAVLGTVGFILLVAILFLTLRVRRRQMREGGKAVNSFHGTAVIDRSHPAAKIIPFGTPVAESHSFQHVPGHDMRIAIRRPDGGWDFTDASEPFTPSGVSDICPSPTSSLSYLIPRNGSSSTQSTSWSPSAVSEYIEQESRVAKLIRLGYEARDRRPDDDLEMSDIPLPHPPPAYGQESAAGPFIRYPPRPRRPQATSS